MPHVSISEKRMPLNFRFFEILMFAYVLFSSTTWFTIVFPTTPVVGLMNVLMVVCLFPMIKTLKLTRNFNFAIASLIFIGLWFTAIKGIVFGVYIFFCFLPAIHLLLLPVNYKKALLKFCTKWYAIFLLVSIIFFYVTEIIPFPSPIPPVDVGRNNFYPTFINYFFYIKPSFNPYDISRFNGFFLEPGHLSLSTIFFIVANKLDFKNNRYLWIMLFAIIISLSLAGYVLLALSWVLFKSNGVKGILLTALIFSGLYIGGQLWNDGDNPLNKKILLRLEYNDEKGIEGNNRTDERTDWMFENLISSGRILTGLPDSENKNVFGAGFKKYIIQYGLIAAILVFVFYWSLMSPRCDKKYAIRFFFLIILAFCDCEYPTWFTWLLPYVLGIGVTARGKKLNVVKIYLQK